MFENCRNDLNASDAIPFDQSITLKFVIIVLVRIVLLLIKLLSLKRSNCEKHFFSFLML